MRAAGGVAVLLGVLGAVRAGDAGAVVRKAVVPFDNLDWRLSEWNRAGGALALTDDVPPGVPETKALAATARFSGRGFEFWTVEAPAPVVVPGRLKKVSLWLKANELAQRFGFTIQFRNAYDQGEVDKKKLEWQAGRIAGEWTEYHFNVPAGWAAPVKIAGFATNNWGQTERAGDAVWTIGRLTVETDLADIDPATGFPADFEPREDAKKAINRAPPPVALFSLDLGTDELGNVFAGEAPVLRLSARSWLSTPVSVDVGVRIASLSDPAWPAVALPAATLRVDDLAALAIRPPTPLPYGVYQVTVDAVRADAEKQVITTRFAHLPAPRPLTDAQRDASPYGLNVHGGRGLMVTPFTKAGIVWFRDYAFAFDWMERAKGADRQYGGWPYPQKIFAAYAARNARMLPCMAKALPRNDPEGTARGLVPDRAWSDGIIDAVQAFPGVIAWEMDNEYDLDPKMMAAERKGNFKTYGAYHNVFGEMVRAAARGQALAVENGRAGINPELIRDLVENGRLANIDVANSHHYCGIEPPETNYANWNFHQGSEDLRQEARLFYDSLRDAKAAAAADGVRRQHWLSEFGWDTKAGHIVSLTTQAAFLPRAFMMLAAAGTERGFWYWDIDNDAAGHFYDGCGLMAEQPTHLPKPALAAYAGLTQILPSAEYVGMTFAGAGTWGYVFRQDDDYVVALWTVEDVDNGPEVDLPARAAHDVYGNALASTRQRLRLAPTYWVGVPAASPYVRQARYAVDSRILVIACAGDDFPVRVSVRAVPGADAPADFGAAMDLPEGWTLDASAPAVAAADGRLEKTLTVRVAPNAQSGDRAFTLALTEDGQNAAAFPYRVLVQPALSLTVPALGTDPGEETLTTVAINRAKRVVRGTLRLDLPPGWTTDRAEIALEPLAPGERREIPVTLRWTATAGAKDTASLSLAADDGSRMTRPLIPGRVALAGAGTLDPEAGDPAAWPETARIPSWILGCTQAETKAEPWMAWSPDGLYVGMRVGDSLLRTDAPQTFWVGDVIELFVDTTADASLGDRFVRGRHQFWIVPRPNRDGQVYVGRWKRGDEIADTQHPLPDARGKATRWEDGYAFTLFIPKEYLDDWNPRAGASMGLNLNISVKGRQVDREVYWPRSKARGIQGTPSQWGRATFE